MGVLPANASHLKPSDTSNHDLIVAQPGEYIVGFINICNVGGVEATARIFVDPDGSTGYDESTAVQWNVDVLPAIPAPRMGPYTIVSGGKIGVRSNVGSALNFTFSPLVKT